MSGCTKETGLGLPDIQKIAFAYGIPYFSCGQKEGLEEVIEAVLRQDGYAICEIYEDVDQTIEPKLGNIVQKDGSIVSPPISDLTPLLDRELYRKYSDFKVYTESIDE